MKKFQITSIQGVDMGIYEGEAKEDAKDALAIDAGYESNAAALKVTGDSDDLIVEEVK